MKEEIPKSFIKKIKELGLKEEDAETLFETKIDWDAVYSDNKIYCVEPGCKFVTEIDGGNLTEHMINVHKYGEYPCRDKYCNYIGHSQKNVNQHNQMHIMESNSRHLYKCPIVNCQSSFKTMGDLETHLRLHKNDLDQCQYCPYRYNRQQQYRIHLN